MNVFLSLLCALGISLGQQPLTMSEVFTDHMVLQRDKEVAIWGQGKAGSEITVSFKDQTVKGTVDSNGFWRVKLAPLATEKVSQELKVVSSTGEKLIFKDVLVGEVWLCSGQSNMEMGISECENGDAEVANATDEMIRIFEPATATSYLPSFHVKAAWARCSPEAVKKGAFGGFGAIAYFFARDLRAKIDVPVGVINSCWGGTPIKAYIPPEAYEESKTLKNVGVGFRKAQKQYVDELKSYMQNTQGWVDDAKKVLAKGSLEIGTGPKQPSNPRYDQACSIYNAMIYPLIPYTIRGFLWYQGEFEVIERPSAKAYYESMHVLVEGWRKQWGEELPFYYVQLAPWAHSGVYKQRMDILDAQNKALDIPKTGIALTYDVTEDLRNIHPVKKQPVASRLANLALTEVYGFQGLQPYSPSLDKVILEGAFARVIFKNVYDGLKTSDGKEPDCFEIADGDGKFIPAVAEIVGKDTVLVSNAELDNVRFVRFGRDYVARPNLRNSAGLPANTFSTFDPRIKSLCFKAKVSGNSFGEGTADYLTDGLVDRGNAWMSEEVNAGEALIELSDPKRADTVVVYPFSDGKDWQRFTVSICDANGKWQEVGKKDDTKPTPEKMVFKFEPCEVQKIKLQVDQTYNWQKARFNEILLFDGYED